MRKLASGRVARCLTESLRFARIAGLVVLLLATSCGDSNGVVEPSGADSSSTCQRAFAAAAAVGDLEDTVEDLDPAVRACSSVAEWTAASAAEPGALDGVDPVVFLTNRCTFGPPDLANTALCREVAAG